MSVEEATSTLTSCNMSVTVAGEAGAAVDQDIGTPGREEGNSGQPPPVVESITKKDDPSPVAAVVEGISALDNAMSTRDDDPGLEQEQERPASSPMKTPHISTLYNKQVGLAFSQASSKLFTPFFSSVYPLGGSAKGKGKE